MSVKLLQSFSTLCYPMDCSPPGPSVHGILQARILEWVRSLGWEDPLEEGMATHPVLLPGESHGQRGLEGYGPWSRKELDMTGVT